jgi:2-polyprenyl-3-methyl-5-hydroxy-6-metoxy-1,4-benzoquinol methylase
MSLVKCQACALIYVNPIFDEHHYQEIYRSQDYQTIVKNLGESSHTYRVERFGTERVQIMQQYHRSPSAPRYLDVGCSTGFVVEAAQNAGWEAFGIDLNPSAIEFGHARGLNLQNTSLEQCDFPAASFDIISLFDVLEHLPNPKEILSQAMHLLKPGGIVFLYVPNYDSASRILMGKDAHFIWPTHHLNYYTPATISDLLARLGLAVEFLSTEGLDIADYLWWRQDQGHAVEGLEPIADSLQFFINAGGYGKNLRILARR